MQTIILADNQPIFRNGTARILSLDDEFRIVAQPENYQHLLSAIAENPGSIVIFSASIRPDMRAVIAALHATNSRGILIAENHESERTYEREGMRTILFRSVGAELLLKTVRDVAYDGAAQQPVFAAAMMEAADTDAVGERVRDRLTPKEMKILALVVEGCKNREIAARLATKEQVVKNYLRSIFDKTGVSDRLELALFTVHHRTLAQAAAEAVLGDTTPARSSSAS